MNLKLFLATICLINLYPVSGQLTKEQLKEITNAVMIDCQSKTGAKESDMEDLRNHKVPKTETGGCFLECVFDASKIMSEGKFYKEGTIAAFATVLGDNHHQTDNMKNMAETCDKEIGDGDADKCKTAELVAECFVKHSQTHGFDLPKHD